MYNKLIYIIHSENKILFLKNYRSITKPINQKWKKNNKNQQYCIGDGYCPSVCLV